MRGSREPRLSGRLAAIGRLTAVLALAGCALFDNLGLPAGSVRFAPPVAYAGWWAMVQQCSGRSATFDDVAWYAVPGVDEVPFLGRSVSGYWSGFNNRIVLAGNSRSSGSLVRHEMLHAVLRSGDHARSQFLDACAGIVACERSCVVDAGPPPAIDPSWLVLPPESLLVQGEVLPSHPASSINGGAFALTITVTNTRSRGVVAQLPPSGDAGPSGSFSYRLMHAGGSAQYDERAWDRSVTVFAPGERKRFIFDFFVGESFGNDGVRPGPLGVQYRYGGSWMGPIAVLVDL